MKERSVNYDNHRLPFNFWRSFLLLTLSVLFLLPSISAGFGFGYGFSLEGFVESFLNSSSSGYVLLFLALFTVITLVLSRLSLFRGPYGQPNAVAAGAVSFSVAAIAVYYLYQSGFQGESLLSWIGFSSGVSSTVILILLALVAVLLIWKLKFSGFLVFGGLGLFLTALATDIIYEKGLAMLFGIVLLIIGLWVRQVGGGAMGMTGGALGRAGAGIGGFAKRKPMWAVAIAGFLGIVIGFYTSPFILAGGVLLVLIGFFGKRGYKRVYSETPWATGREMSKRRAEVEAYQEDARRQQERMRMEHEEAARINAQVDQLRHQIDLVRRNITRYQRAIRTAGSAQEAAMLRNGIMTLENQRRDLQHALWQLTHG